MGNQIFLESFQKKINSMTTNAIEILLKEDPEATVKDLNIILQTLVEFLKGEFFDLNASYEYEIICTEEEQKIILKEKEVNESIHNRD